MGLECCSFSLWVVPEYGEVLFTPNSPWGHTCRLHERSNVASVEDMAVGHYPVTFSPSRTCSAWLPGYHFLMKFGDACPTLCWWVNNMTHAGKLMLHRPGSWWSSVPSLSGTQEQVRRCIRKCSRIMSKGRPGFAPKSDMSAGWPEPMLSVGCARHM